MKKLFIVFICMIFSWNIFAAELQYDCNIGKDTVESIQESTKWKYDIFKQDDILLAQRNLKWYCCKEKILESSEYCANVPEYYADSPYMFAHLMDIWFRKLDWDNNILYPWAELDKDWKARRKQIRKLAEQYEWEMSSDMIQDFSTSWDIWNINGLAKKYQKVCEEALVISDKIFDFHNSEKVPETLFQKCKSVSKDRIWDELLYFQRTMLHKWNKLLTHNMESYLDEYFVENRWPALMEKITVLLGNFSVVVEKIHNWVENCSWW